MQRTDAGKLFFLNDNLSITDDTHLTFSLVLLSRGYDDISHYLVVCTLQIHP